MADSDPIAPQDCEVMLRVRYTTLGASASWVFLLALLILVLVFYDTPYRLLLRGDYYKALMTGFGVLALLPLCIDFIFTKHILFFRDRVVKVWYLLGERTIPYASAKLAVNPAWTRSSVWPFPYPAKGKPEPFRIYETDGGGKVRPIQIPICYGVASVAPETREKVESIISYLVGVEDRSKLYEKSRIFTGAALPKDILCQNQAKTDSSVG